MNVLPASCKKQTKKQTNGYGRFYVNDFTYFFFFTFVPFSVFSLDTLHTLVLRISQFY